MDFLFTIVALVAFAADGVETEQQAQTQLYVKTVPTGATVILDGKAIGKSDGLFTISPGDHRLTLRMKGYVEEKRAIEAREDTITRVEVKLQKQSSVEAELGYVGDKSKAKQSYADSGHAVLFQRPAKMKSIIAVKLYASRYGYPRPPDEPFHVYILDQNGKTLEHAEIPYRKIERGEMKWYTIVLPRVEIPEKFMVALWFNAESTKGVYLGKDTNVSKTHSLVGLPDKGFQKVKGNYEWMIRTVVSSESGRKPKYPKVSTYEPETPVDTESVEAPPVRTWRDSTGAFSVEAQYVGVEDGYVRLKKSDGVVISVRLDKLSKEDRDYVASQTNKKATKTTPAEKRELSHDNGKMAGKSSIAGGGHAVRFSVEGDSWHVTSLRLHGSRYGTPRPPEEDFKVWICDDQFKPIATFQFPYASFARGKSVWKTFRIRPTRVPEKFIVCFGFNPQRTKGIYVSHDGNEGAHSLIGVPGQAPPRPFEAGNWMIRCHMENRQAAADQ